MIKIILVGFDYGSSSIYKTMYDVLLYSIEKHVPDAMIISNWLEEPDPSNRIRAYISNTIKLRKWCQELESAYNGDCIALMDCDLLVIDDFSDVFEKDFDIAYTYREHSKWPLNGGVIFCRANKASRRFFNILLATNEKMYKDNKFHLQWKNKYGGINQAAFGYMLESVNLSEFNLLPLPCSIWNVCDIETDIEKSKIIHYKGPIRRAMFSSSPGQVQPPFVPLVELWKQYQIEMLEYFRSGNLQAAYNTA